MLASKGLLRLALAPILFSLAMVLAGCGGGGGGGGGGGDGGGGGGGTDTGSLMLNVSPSDVTFRTQAPGFGFPDGQLIGASVTGSGKGTLYILITPSNPAVATVRDIVITANTGSGYIAAGNAANLGLGTHNATITIRACLNDSTCSRNEIAGSPKTINVTYIVDGTLISPASLTFNIGNAPVAADFTRSIDVGLYPSSGWTASTDLQLLAVSPTNSPTQNTTVTASIDPALLDQYDGGVYNGKISVLPGSLSATATDVPVTINITRTRVNFVAPYVAESGRAEEVIIRGQYFNLAPPTGVKFGTVDATSFTVVNATEIRATHPALAAGVYTVHVNNAQGIDRTTAELHVVDAAAFPAATIEYPDGLAAVAREILYDAQRSALFVNIYNPGVSDSNRIVRYQYSQGGWQKTAELSVPTFTAYALSADGRSLVVAQPTQSYNGMLRFLDPVTLATIRSETIYGGDGYSLVVANDGNVIFNAGSYSSEYMYSPLRREMSFLRDANGGAIEGGSTAASADGSTVVFSNYHLKRIVRYVSGSRDVVIGDEPEIPDALGSVATNRHGDLFTVNNSFVLDSALKLVGKLPAGASLPVFSPSARRIYAYDSGSIRLFDADVLAVNGMLVEVLPAKVLSPDPGFAGGDGSMAITPDGTTMFIAGRDRIVVQPLP